MTAPRVVHPASYTALYMRHVPLLLADIGRLEGILRKERERAVRRRDRRLQNALRLARIHQRMNEQASVNAHNSAWERAIGTLDKAGLTHAADILREVDK